MDIFWKTCKQKRYYF